MESYADRQLNCKVVTAQQASGTGNPSRRKFACTDYQCSIQNREVIFKIESIGT
jgi:hypothetical protein